MTSLTGGVPQQQGLPPARCQSWGRGHWYALAPGATARGSSCSPILVKDKSLYGIHIMYVVEDAAAVLDTFSDCRPTDEDHFGCAVVVLLGALPVRGAC